MIYMEVFDSCVLSSDQMVAWACIPISEELILTGGDNGSKSHTLSGKQGADLEGTIQSTSSFHAVQIFANTDKEQCLSSESREKTIY